MTFAGTAYRNQAAGYQKYADWHAILRSRSVDVWLLGLALCAVPVSIAVAEILLVGSLLFRLIAAGKLRAGIYFPRVFWFWGVWAALELVVWIGSRGIRQGEGEIRHLLLIAGLFVALTALNSFEDHVAIWRGVILTATVSSLVLIGHFFRQLLFYRGELDPVVYLRGGGLLHHWMIYGTVEILVFAGLLELCHFYPEEHKWLLPVLVVHVIAIVLSLTRMLWLCCLLILLLHLVSIRSRWVWAIPALPAVFLLLAPAAVQSRVTESVDPAYYSNAERLQMIRVGWKMVREKPITGVGPGRVDELYTKYLSPADPVPAYHGHLHNNVVQLAAEFGLPVAGAALIFVWVLFRDFRRRCRLAIDRYQQFVCRTSLFGLAGFLASGMFDYTYGHSLGLILLGFVVLPPLVGTKKVTRSAVRLTV